MNRQLHNGSMRKRIADALMTICVPQRVLDDIIGDLEEESAELVILRDHNIAANWYLKQGIKTALLYLWSQRGDQMILIFALAIFALAILLMLALSLALDAFYDLATIITVILPAVLLGTATTNISAAKNAVAISLMTHRKTSEVTCQSAIQFLRNTGNLALMMGILVFALQWLGYFSMETTKPADQVLANTISTSILSPIYGLLFKILCFTGEKKVEFKCRMLD